MKLKIIKCKNKSRTDNWVIIKFLKKWGFLNIKIFKNNLTRKRQLIFVAGGKKSYRFTFYQIIFWERIFSLDTYLLVTY